MPGHTWAFGPGEVKTGVGWFLIIPGVWTMFSQLPGTPSKTDLSICFTGGFALVPQVPGLTVHGGGVLFLAERKKQLNMASKRHGAQSDKAQGLPTATLTLQPHWRREEGFLHPRHRGPQCPWV